MSHRAGYLRITVALAAMLLSFPATAQEQVPADPAAAAPVAAPASGVSLSRETGEALLDPNLYMGIQEAFQNTQRMRKSEVDPQALKTVMFTAWQHALLQEFRKPGINTSTVGLSSVPSATGAPPPRGIREISLGGIAYATSKNWVVWLNGQRVTPDAIPKQVLDIQVGSDYVELKWFDAFTNLIYPVRLRPHQRFNLDSRIFLPGAPL